MSNRNRLRVVAFKYAHLLSVTDYSYLLKQADENERLTAEVTRQRRNVKHLLDIISDHKVCTNDMEDSCIRIADYEKDGNVWPPDYLRAAQEKP